MNNKKIRLNCRLEWLKYETINKRCKYIDIVVDDVDIIVKEIRLKDYENNYKYNETARVIAVGDEISEGRQRNYKAFTFSKNDGEVVYDINGNEYTTYSNGNYKDPFIAIDEDGHLSVNKYLDAFDMIEDINKENKYFW